MFDQHHILQKVLFHSYKLSFQLQYVFFFLGYIIFICVHGGFVDHLMTRFRVPATGRSRAAAGCGHRDGASKRPGLCNGRLDAGNAQVDEIEISFAFGGSINGGYI